MNHHRRGTGSPIVLIHGIGSRWQVWNPILARLAEHHEVIALDLPGFGASAPDDAIADISDAGFAVPSDAGMAVTSDPGMAVTSDPGMAVTSDPGMAVTSDPGMAVTSDPGMAVTTDGGMAAASGAGIAGADGRPERVSGGGLSGTGSVPQLADRVGEFLTELGVERPTIGGSSLGGGVALELARRGVARSVVAFSPVGFFGAVGAAWCRTVVSAARAGGTTLSPALPRLFATRAGRVALCGVFYGHPAALAPEDCLADARALVTAPGFATARRRLGEWRVTSAITGVPITIAWGDRDLVLPRRQARRARQVLPNARHVRLPGCGHLPFADDPEACARLLLEAA
ncbi:alpha/beta fold hydrolase [Actinoplanes sp. KI2]|uniref:alpha/beta fold hydrolase n=1 Tax=Actinoplanes sp. KI2 TaxID=2983315 RepID=UPI0021D5D942|nr:alpha/beta fold hydrolase [Actinoplanes sp. KI2]MCU7727659.1 alpha/beta fold hydrolase [Actinoplanes sp. KI2]